MSKKTKIYMPSESEDQDINRGIAADPDTYVPSDDAFVQMKRRGRPKSEANKVQLTVRYEQDVIDAFKKSGPGWQSQMNNALRQWLEKHRPA